MPRSLKKGPYCNPKLKKKTLKLLDEAASTNKKVIVKTYARSSTILPEFVGVTFLVHKGNDFVAVNVSETMVGRKLGEFAITRKKPVHKSDDKTKK